MNKVARYIPTNQYGIGNIQKGNIQNTNVLDYMIIKTEMITGYHNKCNNVICTKYLISD